MSTESMELWIHFEAVRSAERALLRVGLGCWGKSGAERREGLKGKTLPYRLCLDLFVTP